MIKRNSGETEINKYSDEIPQIQSRNTANIFVYLLNFCRWAQQCCCYYCRCCYYYCYCVCFFSHFPSSLRLSHCWAVMLLCVKSVSSIFCKVFCRWRIFSYGFFFRFWFVPFCAVRNFLFGSLYKLSRSKYSVFFLVYLPLQSAYISKGLWSKANSVWRANKQSIHRKQTVHTQVYECVCAILVNRT